jgi:hypothetical protein
MFFGTREEREEYVFELYQQGKSIREIARDTHVIFGYRSHNKEGKSID